MKKFLLTICIVMLTVPAFADNDANIEYMNQSQSFSGFNKSLPQSSSFKNLEKNTKFTAPSNDEYSEYDNDGYKIEDDKPVVIEKKVIKTKKNSDGQAKINTEDSKSTPMTYDKFPQNYGNGDSMMMQNMMMPMGNMMF